MTHSPSTSEVSPATETGIDPNAPLAETEPSPLAISAKWWPHLLLGVALAMGIIGINPGQEGPSLNWLPPALVGLWVFIQILSIPRPKKPEPEEPEEIIITPQKTAEAPSATSATTDAATATPTAAPAAPAKKATPVVSFSGIVVLWGSETGTAQGLADMTADKLNASGLQAQSVDIGNMTLDKLQGCSQVLLITSTWGDGEPPSNAIALWEAFQKEKVDLSNVRFSVLALGDTAYPEFCKCGKDFDAFFEAQGAKRIHPRVDCDLDYEAPFEKWLNGVKPALQAVTA